MPNIYLIHGEERFLIKREIENIIKKYPSYEIIRLDCPEPEELFEQAFLPSLFSPQRLFLVDDFDFPSDTPQFFEMLKNPPEGIVIVFVFYKGADQRTKAYKVIGSVGEIIECRGIPEWEEDKVISFIMAEAKNLGKKISKQNAEKLVEYVGRNLSLIHSEIEKLATYVGEREEISEKDITLMISKESYDSFSLLASLRKKNIPATFEALKNLIEDKEDMVSLLSLIANDMRMMYKAQILKKKGLDKFIISQNLKISPYYAQKILQNVDAYSAPELEKNLEILSNCDVKIKSGFDPKIEMYLTLAELQNAKK